MKVINKIYHFIVDVKIPTLAGSLCFFILLNGGSYLFLFVSLSSYFFIDFIPVLKQNLAEGLFKDIILYLFEHNSNLSISIFLFGSSIYSSSSLYYHFMHICELLTKRSVDGRISKRVQSLLLVPSVLILSFLMIILLSFLHLYIGYFSYLFLLLFLFLCILFLNKLILKDYTFKRIRKGVIFSFLYIILFSIFFLIYLKLFSNFKIVYGILSFFIIFMFYIYCITIGILIGIYMNCKNLEVSKFLFQP